MCNMYPRLFPHGLPVVDTHVVDTASNTRLFFDMLSIFWATNSLA